MQDSNTFKENIDSNINNKPKLRQDLEIIASLILNKTKVLDIGCGNGELLDYLVRYKSINCRGLEISNEGVNNCAKKGLSVVQGDADSDLHSYPTKAFDYAILSQTLQATKKPKDVILELTRIAKYAIVSIPNFGHIKNRLYFLLTGKMPVTKTLSYQWYDTPNIHFCTIKDFTILCDDMSLLIEKGYYITSGKVVKDFNKPDAFPNLFGEYGIFVVSDGNLQDSITDLATTSDATMNFVPQLS